MFCGNKWAISLATQLATFPNRPAGVGWPYYGMDSCALFSSSVPRVAGMAAGTCGPWDLWDSICLLLLLGISEINRIFFFFLSGSAPSVAAGIKETDVGQHANISREQISPSPLKKTDAGTRVGSTKAVVIKSAYSSTPPLFIKGLYQCVFSHL